MLCDLFLIISPLIILGQNLYCADSDCKLCTSGYNYQNISCLDQCPTKFSQTGSSCQSTTIDKTLYTGEFFYEFNFSKSCVGVFCHPFGLAFKDQARDSPITTIDRGFYFSTTSRLTSTPGWILAPDFFLGMIIDVVSDGIIFEAYLSQSIVLKVEAVSSNLIYSILLFTSGSFQTRTISIALNYNTWNTIRFTHIQSQGLSTLKLLTIQLSAEAVFNNYEFRLQDPTIKYYFGSSQSSSFQGFLSKATIRNSKSLIINGSTPYYTCGYNHYTNGGTCVTCPSGYQEWPWCTRSSGTHCYSSNCGSCSGFSYNDCTSCTNGNTAPNCDMGKNCQAQTSTFSCTSCSSGTLISGICVTNPYGYPSNSPVINIKFDSFSISYGGIFKSGSNPSTYGPANSPEPDDPIPLKDRGLYFNGDLTYLEALSDIRLSPASTIALWIFPMSNGYIYFTDTFSFTGALTSVYVLCDNMDKRFILVTDSPIQTKNTWLFVVISNNLQSGISTFKNLVQLVQYSSYSVDGYSMYDIPVTTHKPIIGNNGNMVSPYKGYVYSFTIWQNYGVDVTSHSNVCGIELVSLCLSSCSSTSYYNTYQGICLPCDPSCTLGCLSWGTCQKCADIKCNLCDDYVSPCLKNNLSPCISPLSYKAGNCCTANCLSCYGPYDTQCLSCDSGMYLLGSICVKVCPILYTQSNGICTKVTNFITNLILDRILDSYTDAISGLVFSTGVDSSFYPTLKPSDPIPAKNRGYYFLTTSYMHTQNVILSYNYTLNFWMKQLQPGVLFSKGSLIFSTSMSVISTDFSFSKIGCINSTNWMLLTMQFTTNCQGVFSYTLTSSLYAAPIASNTASNAYLNVDSTSIVLGHPAVSFTGFLYRFDLIDYNPDDLKFGYAVCSNSIATGCLWDCDIQQFYENYSCVPCNSTCTQGCVRTVDCNLCNNSICIDCSDFGIGCNKCYQSLTVDEVNCQCLEGYYWANKSFFPYNQDCLQCDMFCKSCSTANSCDTCQSNSHLNSLSKCECDPGYFYNSSSVSCIYCGDICESCSTPNQCSKCMNNSYLNTEFKCLCNSGFYYDLKLNRCQICSDLCFTCSSFLKCNQCVNNSHMVREAKCVCDQGYFDTNNTCSRSHFFASYYLSSTNDITLLFSEALSESLTIDDIKLTVNNGIILFSLIEIDLQRYFITLNVQQTKNETLKLIFKKALTSMKNSLLSTTSLNISLLFSTEGQISTEINQLQGITQVFLVGALATAVGGSLINANLNSFFTFLNCLEIFRYTVLFDLDFDSEFIDLLTNLQATSMLPNVFENFLSESEGVILSGKFVDFGYRSNLILINSGGLISIIVIFIFFSLIIFIIKLFACGSLKWKIEQVANKFKFYIFLKIFIQIFLEILLSSCIGIIYTDFDNIIQRVNFSLSCIFMAIMILGSLFIFWVINKRKYLINKEEFLKKYGMLFEESKDKSTSERLFYMFFILRRVFIVLSAFVITINVLQLTLNITMSLGVISHIDKHVFDVCKAV